MSPYTYFVLIVAFTSTHGSQSLNVSYCYQLPEFIKTGVETMASVYDGQDSIYLLGAGDYDTKMIIKFNVITGEFNIVGTFPPKLIYGFAAMKSDGSIYYFGGNDKGQPTRDVYVVNPKNFELVLAPQQLAVLRQGQSGVAIGDMVYLFAGDACGHLVCWETTVEEHNMKTNTVRVMELDAGYYTQQLRDVAAAAYDEDLYLFGGANVVFHNNDIMKFDGNTEVITHYREKLPIDLIDGSAVIVDGIAYVVPVPVYRKQKIMLVDIKTQNVTELTTKVYMTGQSTSSVYVPKQNRIYVFGLSAQQGTEHKDVLCIDLPKPDEPDCKGRPDGNYAYPLDCSKYLACSNEVAYIMDCPTGLHFNADGGFCDYPENANCEEQQSI